MPHEKKMKILTVCTGNICRSPMAEGILRSIFQDNPLLTVSSAGTQAVAGNPATEFAIVASREKGIDITCHSARPLDRILIGSSDMILCMEPSHAEWVLSIDSSIYEKVYNLADFSDGDKSLKASPILMAAVSGNTGNVLKISKYVLPILCSLNISAT